MAAFRGLFIGKTPQLVFVGPPSSPAVPAHGGQILPASLAVKDVEDGCQHDRTPGSDQNFVGEVRFRLTSWPPGNGFVGTWLVCCCDQPITDRECCAASRTVTSGEMRQLKSARRSTFTPAWVCWAGRSWTSKPRDLPCRLEYLLNWHFSGKIRCAHLSSPALSPALSLAEQRLF
jgi:hypothetical protein